jgi:hypothetical protein
MAEILTESFCERCGTRYTFETAPPRGRSLSALGTFGRGLKHFVVMPDASLDEAMAVARSETESRVTTAQLEAFHRTFNFCLSCRQYTCADCWNAVEGRCLTCAPMPEVEAAPVVEASLEPVVAEAPAEAAVEAIAEPVAEAVSEPVVEPVEAATEPAEPAEPEPVLATEPEPVAAVEPVPEPEQPAPIPSSTVVAPSGEATAASPFPGFLPGRSLDEEIAAYELRIAALAAMPPEPLTRPAEPPTRAPQPAVRSGSLPAPTQRPARTANPPTVVVAAPVQVAAPAATPGTCGTCGLSLSASARFCRRCGARQTG